LDSSAIPTRDAKRRGAGWFPGVVDSGWRNRLGWYEGCHVLLAVTPVGVSTGFGCGAASPKDQPLAETFLALRRHPHPGLTRVGAPACGPYIIDKGCEGQANQATWWRAYGAQVICPPKRYSRSPWPKRLRRWLAGVRQIVETVYEKLHHTFRLDRERPHDLRGLQARLVAKMALHNFCMWLKGQLGRPPLAFTDLVDWSSHAISHQAFKYDHTIWQAGSVCKHTVPNAIKLNYSHLKWEFVWEPLEAVRVISYLSNRSSKRLSSFS